MGYIIATVILGLSKGSDTCFGIVCWRWPFIIEVILLFPLCVLLNLVPREHLNIKIVRKSDAKKQQQDSLIRSLSKESLRALEDGMSSQYRQHDDYYSDGGLTHRLNNADLYLHAGGEKEGGSSLAVETQLAGDVQATADVQPRVSRGGVVGTSAEGTVNLEKLPASSSPSSWGGRGSDGSEGSPSNSTRRTDGSEGSASNSARTRENSNTSNTSNTSHASTDPQQVSSGQSGSSGGEGAQPASLPILPADVRRRAAEAEDQVSSSLSDLLHPYRSMRDCE